MENLSLSQFKEINKETRNVSDLATEYQKSISLLRKYKIIVLDDDPTGTQTMHDVPVYTKWSCETFREVFNNDSQINYILTNSRSFLVDKTILVHKEIADNLVECANQTPYLVISRSDSCLRGYYPLEMDTLRKELEKDTKTVFDGEVFCPFFEEGKRFTINNIHYMLSDDLLVPIGYSDYAKDKTFGYHSSNLVNYCIEKSGGVKSKNDIVCISLKELKSCDYSSILDKLIKCKNNKTIILNATNKNDLKVFSISLIRAISLGKKYLFRTAASFPQVLGNMESKPFLNKEQIYDRENKKGGLVVIGSHVKKTTLQLEMLKRINNIQLIEFDQHLVLSQLISGEIKRVAAKADEVIDKGETAVIYTRRDRIDLDDASKEAQMKITNTIAHALVKIVTEIESSPSFIITKGGITSSDIITKALKIKKAIVIGQIDYGIPVWKTQIDGKTVSIIIFPGNVGDNDTLASIVNQLQNKSNI